MNITLKRVYDEVGHNDGTRVLVDRVWPRGVSKEHAQLDDWIKDVSPSTELRKWFGHDPDRFEEFSRRYREELETDEGREALQRLRDTATGKRLTLLTATKDIEHSQVTVLASLLSDEN